MPLHSLMPLPARPRWAAGTSPKRPPHCGPCWPMPPPTPPAARPRRWPAPGAMAGRAGAGAAAAGGGLPRPYPLLRNDEAGRPFLAGAGPQPAVSLSHSGEWVVALLALPGTAVGIDVEAVRDKAQRIARKFLKRRGVGWSGKNIPTLSPGLPADQELFSLLWSAKETLYKLAGQRGIIFRENLLLDLPAGPWPMPGALPARLRLAEVASRHQICYLRPAAGYVLTYCCQVFRSIGCPRGLPRLFSVSFFYSILAMSFSQIPVLVAAACCWLPSLVGAARAQGTVGDFTVQKRRR
ncbi:MAG: 4'-phosphopantetheinyl transferase superfamily protein [Hymenobacter sp.]